MLNNMINNNINIFRLVLRLLHPGRHGQRGHVPPDSSSHDATVPPPQPQRSEQQALISEPLHVRGERQDSEGDHGPAAADPELERQRDQPGHEARQTGFRTKVCC